MAALARPPLPPALHGRLGPMFTDTAEFYDLFYEEKDYAGEVRRLREIVEARAPGARTLLDVACGTGMHLAELRAQYRVEGVDLDEGLLAVAAKRLPDVPMHAGDMRAFDLGRRFDVVTCLFSSIGYVRTTDGLRSAVAAVFLALIPAVGYAVAALTGEALDLGKTIGCVLALAGTLLVIAAAPSRLPKV